MDLCPTIEQRIGCVSGYPLPVELWQRICHTFLPLFCLLYDLFSNLPTALEEHLFVSVYILFSCWSISFQLVLLRRAVHIVFKHFTEILGRGETAHIGYFRDGILIRLQ